MAIVKAVNVRFINAEPNAGKMKHSVMAYFRFQRRFHLVCTEFDLKDVFAVKFEQDMQIKEAIECEIKISLADLKRERKKPKHRKMTGITHFYFAVPSTILRETVNFCEEFYPQYGVIHIGNGLFDPVCSIAKSAKRLPNTIGTSYLRSVLSRMSCEIITLRGEKLRRVEK